MRKSDQGPYFCIRTLVELLYIHLLAFHSNRRKESSTITTIAKVATTIYNITTTTAKAAAATTSAITTTIAKAAINDFNWNIGSCSEVNLEN